MCTVTTLKPKACWDVEYSGVQVEQWDMGSTNLELLYQEWQWLVSECASAIHAARGNGASPEELRSEERRHGLRIDAVYARLKQAEAQCGAYQRYRHKEPETESKPLY
jgi:hypothetical protein